MGKNTPRPLRPAEIVVDPADANNVATLPNEAYPDPENGAIRFPTREGADKQHRDHLILQFAVGVVGVVAGAGVPQNAHDIAHAKDNIPVVKRVAQNTIIVATHLADAYLEATK